ncbi:MAG: hypothetical protein M0Z66_16640 [Thermaerobacter sp.]|nr:hypothetical protein [Thermaerobacter sp.]
MTDVIQVIDLQRSYRMGSVEVAALRAVNFRIGVGEMVAIMGPRAPASRRS